MIFRAGRAFCRGKHVAKNIKQALIVPGSRGIKSQAEKGRTRTKYYASRFEWGDAGGSMCIGMNADVLPRTSVAQAHRNRNFEGRQGRTAARTSSARSWPPPPRIAGHFVDVRSLDGVAPVE